MQLDYRHVGRIFLLLAGFLILGGCAALPDNSGRPYSATFPPDPESTLGRLVVRANLHKDSKSALLLLENGLDAFVARAVLAQLAERSIDAQYYMIHNDHVGALFADQLLQAADRGVRVRVLMDDIDLSGRDIDLLMFDAHPNIQVRVFNPFGRNVGRLWQFATGFGRQTRRAHNKSFTVDNLATILGGRNIGDEYFSRDSALEFQDVDVLAIGAAAQQVSKSFDEYWNDEFAYPVSVLLGKRVSAMQFQRARRAFAARLADLSDSIYLQRLQHSALANAIRQGRMQWVLAEARVFSDQPAKLRQKPGDPAYQMLSNILPYMRHAKQELIIFSPYFVPGRAGVKFLNELAAKGVKVRILTNSLASTDVSIVHASYSRYRKALLRGGVELYELNRATSWEERQARKDGKIGASKSSLHAKAFVVDRNTVFVGSLNLDPRSVSQNTEIGMIFESPQIAGEVADFFDEHVQDVAFRLELGQDEYGREKLLWHGMQNGEPKTYEQEPMAGFWLRLTTCLLKWLPIESQL